jgi:S1-C subfamily serine protease
VRRSAAALAVAALAATAAPSCGAADDGPVAASDRAREIRAAGCSGADELAAGMDIGDGLVLTVAHVLRGASTVAVDGDPATVLALDLRADAAVVSTARRLPVMPFAAGASGPASLVTDHGSRPVGVLGRVTVQIDEPRDATTYERAGLVLDRPVAPGDSGAGVVDAGGRLVGMVFATSRERRRSYAVAGDELAAVVARGARAAQPADVGAC